MAWVAGAETVEAGDASIGVFGERKRLSAGDSDGSYTFVSASVLGAYHRGDPLLNGAASS